MNLIEKARVPEEDFYLLATSIQELKDLAMIAEYQQIRDFWAVVDWLGEESDRVDDYGAKVAISHLVDLLVRLLKETGMERPK